MCIIYVINQPQQSRDRVLFVMERIFFLNASLNAQRISYYKTMKNDADGYSVHAVSVKHRRSDSKMIFMINRNNDEYLILFI